MIYTSYFSSKKFDAKNGVAITLGGNFWKGEMYKALAPTPQILSWWKSLSEDEQKSGYYQTIYERLYYRDVLSKLNVHKVVSDLNDKVMLCFEKSGAFCHRHIVAKWLRDNGYKCEEL